MLLQPGNTEVACTAPSAASLVQRLRKECPWRIGGAPPKASSTLSAITQGKPERAQGRPATGWAGVGQRFQSRVVRIWGPAFGRLPVSDTN